MPIEPYSESGVYKIHPSLWSVWWDDINHPDKMIRRRYFCYIRLEPEDGLYRVYFDRMEQSEAKASRATPFLYPVPAGGLTMRLIAAAAMEVLVAHITHPIALPASVLGAEIVPLPMANKPEERLALAKAALAETATSSPEDDELSKFLFGEEEE
jgi:hypothetical protein